MHTCLGGCPGSCTDQPEAPSSLRFAVPACSTPSSVAETQPVHSPLYLLCTQWYLDTHAIPSEDVSGAITGSRNLLQTVQGLQGAVTLIGTALFFLQVRGGGREEGTGGGPW